MEKGTLLLPAIFSLLIDSASWHVYRCIFVLDLECDFSFWIV